MDPQFGFPIGKSRRNFAGEKNKGNVSRNALPTVRDDRIQDTQTHFDGVVGRGGSVVEGIVGEVVQ